VKKINGEIMFVCIECGKKVKLNIKEGKKIQCPHCGYRILRKERIKTPKKVPAV